MSKASQEQLQAFGRALAACLLDAGMSRRELADTLDITTQAVDHYVLGEREADPRTVQIMEETLGVPGQLIQHLGYQPTVQMAARGGDLDELAEVDPDEYARLQALAAKAVAKARKRRLG